MCSVLPVQLMYGIKPMLLVFMRAGPMPWKPLLRIIYEVDAHPIS